MLDPTVLNVPFWIGTELPTWSCAVSLSSTRSSGAESTFTVVTSCNACSTRSPSLPAALNTKLGNCVAGSGSTLVAALANWVGLVIAVESPPLML